MFQKTLTDRRANESDRLIAAELAGDFTVINDKLANTLLTVVSDACEPEQLRAKAAISFGPALEQAYTDEFDEPEAVPITEFMFRKIQNSLQKLYLDNSTPKEVKRRILEASVRAPEDCHGDAIRAAYSSGDKEWMLTAVFAMRWVRGFDDQILAALKSDNPEIHYEAVSAAGDFAVTAAWPHALELIQDTHTPKPLLLAAIEAAGSIRPNEAAEILSDLANSPDEEIAEVANEALLMAESVPDEAEGEDEEGEWVLESGTRNRLPHQTRI